MLLSYYSVRVSVRHVFLPVITLLTMNMYVICCITFYRMRRGTIVEKKGKKEKEKKLDFFLSCRKSYTLQNKI